MGDRPWRLMDTLRIHSLEVRCIVGVRPRERLRPQAVLVDLALGVDTSRAARTGRITHTVDYALVAEQTRELLRFREYRLIESATEELCALLFSAHPALQRVDVQLTKPLALGARARGASVDLSRERAQFAGRVEPREFGHVEVLLETAEACIASAHVEPGARLPWSALPGDARLDCLLEGELQCDGQTLHSGALRAWRVHGAPEAPSAGTRGAELSCCGRSLAL